MLVSLVTLITVLTTGLPPPLGCSQLPLLRLLSPVLVPVRQLCLDAQLSGGYGPDELVTGQLALHFGGRVGVCSSCQGFNVISQYAERLTWLSLPARQL